MSDLAAFSKLEQAFFDAGERLRPDEPNRWWHRLWPASEPWPPIWPTDAIVDGDEGYVSYELAFDNDEYVSYEMAA